MRRERRVRWEPASGVVDHIFDDEPVPGTQGLPIDLLRKVEPFPTGECVGYDTAFLAGHVVEHYKVVLVEAAEQSREQMLATLRAVVRRAGARRYASQPARSTRRSAGQTFKHLLVPIWLLTYNYGRKAYQVLVNGYTGKIAGKYPYSVWKVLLLILVILVVVGFVLVMQGGRWAGRAGRTHRNHVQ